MIGMYLSDFSAGENGKNKRSRGSGSGLGCFS